MLTQRQVDFFWEHGYLRIPKMFSPREVAELSESLDWAIQEWALRSAGWTGPWRKALLGKDADKARLTAMHDLQLYSDVWQRALTKPRLANAMHQLLDSEGVELHHSTLHAKPPEVGQPFPTHQDQPFYPHENVKFIDVLIHLDDTNDQNGEIRYLDGSHKWGPLEHITETEDGPCTPHLPVDKYLLEDTVPVPAQAGDVVCMTIFTVHGSYLNKTDQVRRMVRAGYRDPANRQLGGQSYGRPGLIVWGRRAATPEQKAAINAGTEAGFTLAKGSKPANGSKATNGSKKAASAAAR